jgi:type I restriction enzyme S subunit
MSCESATFDGFAEGKSEHVTDWKELTLDKVFSLSSGTTKPPDFSAIRLNETPYPVYGGNGVSGWTGCQCEKRETLVIGRVGHYCGSVFYANEPLWITDNALYVTELKLDIDMRFLYFLLCHLELGKYRNKGAQPLVSQKPIYGIKAYIPPKPEQKKIAEILTCWDKAIELVERLIEEKVDEIG